MSDVGQAQAESQGNGKSWDGDLLDRFHYADYLTKYLVARVNTPDAACRSFVLALDAPWGVGKTFFVTKWEEDLRSGNAKHLTLFFNAWSEDTGTDPLFAFMAAFRDALDRASQDLPKPELFKRSVRDRLVTGRKALVPMGKVALNAIVKKVLALSTEELVEAVSNSNGDSSTSGDGGLSEGDLDKIFDAALKEQSERKEVVRLFAEDLESITRQICDGTGRSLPMFVFIDELDRCRPDFAISLLEGIKHLFGIRGVCFVVSTNMEQLSEAIKSVYGSGFAAHAYLKRFFDVTFTLPDPPMSDFIEATLNGYPHLLSRRIYFGGGMLDGDLNEQELNATSCLEWVFSTFNVDLRSIRSIVETIFAAGVGIPESEPVHLLWLSMLATIKHLDQNYYFRIAKQVFSISDAMEGFNALTSGKKVVRDFYCFDESGRREHRSFELGAAFREYYENHGRDLFQVRSDLSCNGPINYPHTITACMTSGLPNSYRRNEKRVSTITRYGSYIDQAGHFST